MPRKRYWNFYWSNQTVMRSLLGLFLTLCFSSACLAETVYVSDRLKINLRTGATTANRIIATLRSGTPLTVLSTDKLSGYTEVKTASGKVGWVLSRQLDKQPSARNSLMTTKNELTKMQENLDDITQKYEATLVKFDTMNASLQEMFSENKILTEELSDIRLKASSALLIEKERNELESQLTDAKVRLEELQQQNDIFSHSDRNVMFMLGAGAITIGLFLGLILPRLSTRKQRSSWSSDSYLS